MMENLTSQEKDLVKAGFIMLVLLFCGIIYYDSQFLAAQLEKEKTEVAELKKKIRDQQERKAEMDAMAANMEEVRRKQQLLAQVVRRLPATADPEGFYQALEPVLTATQFEYTELQPQASQTRTAYLEIPYRILGKARYHDFGQFLNMIEENPDRLMRVRSFTIKNQEGRPSIHPVTVDIASFMFNSRG